MGKTGGLLQRGSSVRETECEGDHKNTIKAIKKGISKDKWRKT